MKISKEKREKISEQIIALLYSTSPKSLFTSYIAKEIARDEAFTKHLLEELKKKGLVVEIRRNSKGVIYLQRIRWKISDRAYEAYNAHQN